MMKPSSTNPSMKAACAGQSDCSSSGRDESHCGPERWSTTRNIATLAFYHRRREDESRSRLELRQPPLEEASFGLRVNELERALVGGAGVFNPIEPAQQLRARRVHIVVLVKLEALHEGERGLDLARFGDGGGSVELHDRRAGDAG